LHYKVNKFSKSRGYGTQVWCALDCLSWYWHSKSLGGFGVIDFLTKIEGMSFRGAVEAVTGIDTVTLKLKKDTAEPVILFLPEKKGKPIRLYDYLCVKRGILGDIVHELMNKYLDMGYSASTSSLISDIILSIFTAVLFIATTIWGSMSVISTFIDIFRLFA
jgi:hypothetical protein